MAVRIVTDSCCDLTAEEVERHRDRRGAAHHPLRRPRSSRTASSSASRTSTRRWRRPPTPPRDRGAGAGQVRGGVPAGQRGRRRRRRVHQPLVRAVGHDAVGPERGHGLEGALDVRVVDSRSITSGLGTQVVLAARGRRRRRVRRRGRRPGRGPRRPHPRPGRRSTPSRTSRRVGASAGPRRCSAPCCRSSRIVDISTAWWRRPARPAPGARRWSGCATRWPRSRSVEHLCRHARPGARRRRRCSTCWLRVPPRDDIRVGIIGPVIGTHGGPRVLGVTCGPAPDRGPEAAAGSDLVRPCPPPNPPPDGSPTARSRTTRAAAAAAATASRRCVASRRHGRGVGGHRRGAAPPGGGEGAPPPPRRRRHLRHPLPPGGGRRRPPRPPGIVAIYDTCSEDGVEAIVMELVPGPTLRERLDDGTAIDPWRPRDLAAQVADALEAAHAAGLVHRDVKPANILLPGDGRVMVADFGIAKAAEEADLTQPGMMLGHRQVPRARAGRGPPGRRPHRRLRLGVVLYEMLCGRPPFAADTDAATALARLHRDPLSSPAGRGPSVPSRWRTSSCGPWPASPEHAVRPRRATSRAALLAAGATPTPDADLTATAVTAVPPRPAPVPLPRRVPAPPPAPPPAAPSFRQTERSWLVPTLLLVGVAWPSGVAGLLFGRSGAGDLLGGVTDAISGTIPRSTDLTIAEARAFDPSAMTGRERRGLRPSPSTATPTPPGGPRATTTPTSPTSSPASASCSELESAAQLDELSLDQPHRRLGGVGVRADRADAADIAGWGAAGRRRSTASRPARSTVDLDGASGDACWSGSPTAATAPTAAPVRDPGGHRSRRVA